MLFTLQTPTQEQYGPVSLETLRAWAREGRIEPNWRIFDHTSMKWMDAPAHPNISEFFHPPTAAIPPAPAPVAAPAPAPEPATALAAAVRKAATHQAAAEKKHAAHPHGGGHEKKTSQRLHPPPHDKKTTAQVVSEKKTAPKVTFQEKKMSGRIADVHAAHGKKESHKLKPVHEHPNGAQAQAAASSPRSTGMLKRIGRILLRPFGVKKADASKKQSQRIKH